MSRARRFALYALPPLAVALGIFALSSRSSLGGPTFPGADKLAHLAVYGLLAWLCARMLWGYGVIGAARWGGALLAFGYGLTDELHQRYVPGRSSEGADLLADALGAVVGASIYVYGAARRQPR